MFSKLALVLSITALSAVGMVLSATGSPSPTQGKSCRLGYGQCDQACTCQCDEGCTCCLGGGDCTCRDCACSCCDLAQRGKSL